MAHSKKPLAVALGAAFLATSVAPLASASSNPFAAQQLSGGYDLVNYEKHADGSCGEAKCGAKKAEAEGNCGEKKKAETEGTCGDKKAAAGDDMSEDATDETKAASEGTCGNKKAAEGNCGAK